jgi:hypothetical protein
MKSMKFLKEAPPSMDTMIDAFPLFNELAHGIARSFMVDSLGDVSYVLHGWECLISQSYVQGI